MMDSSCMTRADEPQEAAPDLADAGLETMEESE